MSLCSHDGFPRRLPPGRAIPQSIRRPDAGETENLADRFPIRVALLEGLLREQLSAGGSGREEVVELTDEIRESLRALGYRQ